MKIEVKDNLKRIDKYLTEQTNYSRTNIQKMIDNGFILVNNQKIKSNYILKEYDLITIKEPKTKEETLKKEDIKLNIVYEDEYLLVVDKPSGMVVHPGDGNEENTLVNALINYTVNLSNINSNERPGIVHRLDKDTSGLLIVAKTNETHEKLSLYFKENKITRIYTALLVGSLTEDTALINAPIGRSSKNRKEMSVTNKNSKKAISHLRVLKRFKDFTLVEFKLETGRTHQIRVHAKYIGYPVYNDKVYYSNKSSSFGQFLHASSLKFDHPITKKELEFISPLPKEIEDFIKSIDFT